MADSFDACKTIVIGPILLIITIFVTLIGSGSVESWRSILVIGAALTLCCSCKCIFVACCLVVSKTSCYLFWSIVSPL